MQEGYQINQKLPLRSKVAYGTVEFCNTLGLVLFTSFGMYFLTDVALLSPGVAGVVTAVGTLINAITGPLIGVWSDNCKSKYGRRRPFIIASAIPFCITVWLLFTNWGFTGGLQTAYYLVVVTLFYGIMCCIDVPYTSLGAEMTQDYDERTSLNFWRSLFCQIASIISGALPISIAAMIGTAVNNVSMGWSIMAGIFAVISAIFILIGWNGTRGKEMHREESDKLNLKDSLEALKNKSFLGVIGIYSSGIAAYSIGLMVNVYFLTDYVGLSENNVTIVLLIFNVAAIIWLPFIPKVSGKYSKRVAWVVFFGIWGLTILLTLIIVRPGSFVSICIITFFGGAGSMVAYTVGWAMLPDSIEIDEFKCGKRREGLFYGILTIVQKGSSALVIFIGGLLLEMVNYDETLAVQSAATCEGVRFIYVIGTLFFILLSFFFVWKYPITREKHHKLIKALDAKKTGEEPDITGIEDLIG